MAIIKSYTDLSQSKILSKILSDESADMKWVYVFGKSFPVPVNNKVNENEVSCWSLSALLGVLPDYILSINTDGTVFVVCESKKPMISDACNNPVDACYSLILKLNELNLL